MKASSATGLFFARLRRIRSGWQAGLLLAGLLDVVTAAGICALLCVLLDLLFVPDTTGRQALRLGALLAVGALAGLGLLRVLRFRDPHLAQAADRQQAPWRRPVFGAWDLLRRPAGGADGSALHAFLVEAAAARAGVQLRALRPGQRLPWPRIGSSLSVCAAALAALTATVAVHPRAVHTALTRVARPAADLPPYSALTFRITPPVPVLLYGGSTNLLVEIRGGPVTGPVWLVTRRGRDRHRTPCFQETPNRFGQRVEQVVEPLEFCFATRRARSPWHRLDLRLQPQIGLAVVTVEPPAYSRLPREHLAAGREPVRALRGSRLTLQLTSNRPLRDGTLRIRPADRADATTEVVGQREGRHTVQFAWTLEETAELEAVIRDVRGTPCRQPLRLVQQLVPDAPPVVTLSDPPPFALATPATRLPLAGTVEDDLGLRRAGVVRTVVGFRDRSLELPLPPAGRRADVAQELDLGLLGVAPGQTLEFYLEAADSNPSLAGLGVSELATVRIISEDEYAATLRSRASMEQFGDRFRALAAQMEAYREAVRALRDAARDGAPRDKQQAALDAARAAARQTAELAARVAADFPIYEMEQGLAQIIQGGVKDLERWALDLDSAQVGVTRLDATAAHVLEGLGNQAEALARQAPPAAAVEAVARVMWLSADFRALLERQRLLVRRLEATEHSMRAGDREQLPQLGERQAEVERQLAAFVRALRERAGQLPDEFGDLRASALEFATAAAGCGADTNMVAATAAARNTRPGEARAQARDARDKLEALLTRPGEGDCFGGLCKGALRFEVPDDQRQTLAQMLASILRGGRGGNPGQGQGSSPGGGVGGDPSDGYWMPGNTPLNIPAYGPARSDFTRPGVGGLIGRGDGRGAGRGGDGPAAGMQERLGAAEPVGTRTPAAGVELVPEKYQEAVKRYFGGME